jgi:hypothetical protein
LQITDNHSPFLQPKRRISTHPPLIKVTNNKNRGGKSMNPFVFACITPHGGEIIPELVGSKPERMALTRKNMEKLGNLMSAAKPDGIWQTLILAVAIPPEEREVEFLSCETPTYFGLICAAYFQVKEKTKSRFSFFMRYKLRLENHPIA